MGSDITCLTITVLYTINEECSKFSITRGCVKPKMKNKKYSETALIILEHIAKYSGFSSALGLFDGKTGAAILLYHGSNSFRSSQLKLVADTLIDDIIEDIDQITSADFSKGLIGIAWGINHLISNGFIVPDTTWFDNIDRILFCRDKGINMIDETEYSFLGLYILARYNGSSEKNFWIIKANDYCYKMLNLLETEGNIFIQQPSLLMPFLYFMLEWEKCYFPFFGNEIFRQALQSLTKINFGNPKTLNCHFTSHLFQKLSQKDVSIKLPEKLSMTDINIIYFNQLLYPDCFHFFKKPLRKNISLLIADERLFKELLFLFNHRAIGLSQYIPGFAWSLLQYNQTRF